MFVSNLPAMSTLPGCGSNRLSCRDGLRGPHTRSTCETRLEVKVTHVLKLVTAGLAATLVVVVRYDAAQAAAPDSEPSALVVSVVNAFALSVLLALILGGLKLVGVRNGVLRCQFIFGTFFISIPFFTHVAGGMPGVVLGLFCWALTLGAYRQTNWQASGLVCADRAAV